VLDSHVAISTESDQVIQRVRIVGVVELSYRNDMVNVRFLPEDINVRATVLTGVIVSFQCLSSC
jgi:hypothetical protein